MLACAVKVYGFSKPEWNKTWAREAYDNDGQPVFSTRTTRQRYFLYYRSLESQWVIDGAVEAEGVVFSTSKTRTLDPAAWHTSPSWAQNRSIHVTKARNAKAFNSESVIVAIDRPGIGGSVTAEEAGEYLRQPAYDNICDKPHYIKFGPGERRHLFWNKVESCWQICPTCTDEDGAFCMGDKGDNMEGVWWSVPPDIVERGVKIRMVTLGQRLDEQVGGGGRASEHAVARLSAEGAVLCVFCQARLAEEAAVRNQAAGRGGAAAQAVEEDGDDEARKRRSEVEAVLTSGQLAQMEIEMVKWNDSNHEVRRRRRTGIAEPIWRDQPLRMAWPGCPVLPVWCLPVPALLERLALGLLHEPERLPAARRDAPRHARAPGQERDQGRRVHGRAQRQGLRRESSELDTHQNSGSGHCPVCLGSWADLPAPAT